MNLKESYNQEAFLDYLKDFLPEFAKDVRSVVVDERYRTTKEARFLGSCENLELSVFELKVNGSAERKISQARDGFRIMKEYQVYRALMAYFSDEDQNWRFSLMQMTPDLNEKGKVITKISNPRRYSFYLGPDAKTKTAENFLIRKGKTNDFNDLLDRFNVEIVTREFYQNYKKLFDRLLNHLKSDKAFNVFTAKHGLKLEIFAKKLLGQIVFIYFLQKKGWLGAKKGDNISNGDKRFLRNLFEKCKQNSQNFFNEYLEYLFYECLNKLPERAGSFYRDKFECQIPFLNGGLFEPVNDYNWKEEFVNIPNEIFSASDESGILDIFDIYNFTIDENTPDDQEVSVDPEMLGKVFENLLEDNIRKGQGAFYTPREIVHYMCHESLINYLDSNSNIGRKTAEEYVKYFDIEESIKIATGWEEQMIELDELMKNIKVCDPACGSGAYLVGMLNEIIKLRYLFRMFNQKLPQKTLYDLKKETIQNCLYGVDIDPGAVDIAKLRFWLSIVVDENIEDIEPLPNLDFKIMQGNSLLEDLVIGDSIIKFNFDGRKKIDGRTKEKKEAVHISGFQAKLILDESDTLVEKLEKYHTEYFNINDPEKKKMLKRKIDNIEDELIQSKCQEEIRDAESHIQNNPNDSRKVLKNTERVLAVKEVLNKWKKDHLRPFFPWKLHFSEVFNRENGGFDVVIANPPYIDSESMVKGDQAYIREAIQKKYKWTKGNWDIYIAFFELGFNLLDKTGTLTFITPDKWISKPFGDELRKGTINNLFIILRAGRKVFESANVDSIISFFSKKEHSELEVVDFQNGVFNTLKTIQKDTLLSPFAMDYLFSESLSILLKIGNLTNKLSSIGKCENACATSDAYKLKPLIVDIKEKKYLNNDYLRIINTGTISKYHSRWGKQEMKYLKDKYLYPVIKKDKFFSLFKNSYSEKSTKPKIIIKGLNLLDGCLDEGGSIIPGKTTLMITSNNLENLKYLLAIVNSKLAFFYIKEKYPAASYNQGTSFTKEMISDLPLPDISNADNKKILEIVDKILEITKSDDYINNSEKQTKIQGYKKQIDQMVYKLYGLTEEEMEVVESN